MMRRLYLSTNRLTHGMVQNIVGKLKKLLGAKTYLSYLEIHLTDHCNLNCRGCGHFSPIAEKRFADPTDHDRDMLQLRKLFSTIKKIHLLGGEPLLHPRIESFLFSTRSCFPRADIRIVTNGLLLHEISNSFWDACRSNSIALDVTIYPPLKSKESSFVELANSKGVKVFILGGTPFYALYNKNGDSDIENSFKNCITPCPNLREGKLYVCPVHAYAHYFNKRFGTQIPFTGSVNIYASKLSGWDVKELLSKAPATCRYCTLGWDNIPTFSWSTSKQIITEWDGTTSQESAR